MMVGCRTEVVINVVTDVVLVTVEVETVVSVESVEP
jgi:hypothetical protein